MASKTYLAFSFLIHSICITLTILTSVTLVLKYLKNDDTPKISYKKFNESPEDVYPEITICFRQSQPSNTIYKDTYLKAYNLDSSTYHGYLRGEDEFWKKNSVVDYGRQIDFERATLGIKKFIPAYSAIYHDDTQLKGSINAFNVTFQKPGMRCFSRRSDVHLSRNSLFRENIALSLASTSAKIFLHFPDQVLRNVFGKGNAWKSIFTVNKDMLLNTSTYEVQMSQINVIKQRPDGKLPCNPDSYDDIRLWQEIFRRAGCFPSYWKRFVGKDISLEQCDTKEELKSIYDMALKNKSIKNDIIASVMAPCNEMRTIVDIEPVEGNKGDFKLKNDEVLFKFLYLTDDYQELKNKRNFDIEMLWSGIGGFLGIFAGYGLLQVLLGALDCISNVSSSKTQQNN